MACDICGVKGTSLNDLRKSYQTNEIKAICPDCEKAINKQLNSIQSMTVRIQTALLKRFMGERKSSKDHHG